MDAKYIVASVVCSVILYGAYSTGYEKAETEATLKIESMKLDHANQIIEAQQKEKELYDKKTKELLSRHADERNLYLKRMRQLEAKLQSRGDVETITRERDDCLGLAVRGERLLQRADAIIESLEH